MAIYITDDEYKMRIADINKRAQNDIDEVNRQRELDIQRLHDEANNRIDDIRTQAQNDRQYEADRLAENIQQEAQDKAYEIQNSV